MTTGGDVAVGLLGPLVAWRDGQPLHLGGPRPRSVLALLALRPGTVVPTEEICVGVWGDDHADGTTATLQVHVSNLRKVLGPSVIETRPPGYRLALPPAAVDHVAADQDLRAGRDHHRAGRLDVASAALDAALARWRGRPLADLADVPFVPAAATWLDERRLLAVEERAEVELARGRHRQLVVSLEEELATHTFREALWAHLMVALYRCGRQADALGAYQRARRALADGLGVDPGPELQALEAAVLVHAPSLGAPRPRPPVPPAAGATTTVPAWTGAERWLRCAGLAPVAVDGVVVFGRGSDATVVLEGPSVSRRHAELRPTVAGDLLVDLGSTNGTLVNGEPITVRVLADGDVIGVGHHTVTYLAGGPSAHL